MSWQLVIPRERLEAVYKGLNIDLDVFEQEPTEDTFVMEYLSSKLWRLNNLYTIVNKKGKRVLFRMNYAQHLVYAASLTHPRIIILKSRQQGISTFWLICFLDDAVFLSDLNIGMMAQGLNEAGTLLKRAKLGWNTFSDSIKGFLAIGMDRDNAAELGWTNGSTLFIRTSFRSTTLQRLHVSELGKIANNSPERVRELKTGTLQAIEPGNVIAVESTAEGDNEFKAMWTQAKLSEARINSGTRKGYAGKDFMPVFLSWVFDPDCASEDEEEPSSTEAAYFTKIEGELEVTLTTQQKNFWIGQYRELGEYIYQEYPATPEEAFTRVNDGSYYGVAYMSWIVKRGRILPNLYDVNLPVAVAMDLGYNDTFSMVYFQRFQDEWRIIDEYENSGEGLEHYVRQIESTGYEISNVICPHDIEVTELGTGKSRKARLRELGVNNIVVLSRTSIEAGIEQVRKLIPFVYIDERCRSVQGAYQSYSKEWDEKKGVWKNKPLHNKWSHMADAIRYMAMSNERHITSKPQGGRKYRGGFEV